MQVMVAINLDNPNLVVRRITLGNDMHPEAEPNPQCIDQLIVASTLSPIVRKMRFRPPILGEFLERLL